MQQHNPKDLVSGSQGIPPNMTTIAAKMNEGGYISHMAGKYNVGMSVYAQTPAGRGYKTGLCYFDYGQFGERCGMGLRTG